MTDLTPVPGWDGIPQLEVTTVSLGGPGAPMNTQAQALFNRTEQHRLLGTEHGLQALLPGAILTPVADLTDVPEPTNEFLKSVAQALLNRVKWLQDNGIPGSGTASIAVLLELEMIGGLSAGPYPLDIDWSMIGPTMVFLDGILIMSSYYSMTATELTLIGVTASNYERIIVRGSPA